MYDKELLLDLLENMILATTKVLNRTKDIASSDDFLDSEENQIILDSVCMQLVALGEAVKEVDKLTDRELLSRYDNIPWKQVSGMRDILSHHYFDLNAEVVFDVSKNHMNELKETLQSIKSDLLKA